jgi:hypothetical protein
MDMYEWFAIPGQTPPPRRAIDDGRAELERLGLIVCEEHEHRSKVADLDPGGALEPRRPAAVAPDAREWVFSKPYASMARLAVLAGVLMASLAILFG